MLVLTRKLMEKLYIGGDICVTVVRLEGSQVRLGIEAPRHIPVVRAELTRHPRPAAVEPAPPSQARPEPPPRSEPARGAPVYAVRPSRDMTASEGRPTALG